MSTLGSELSILETVPLEDIGRADSSLLAEAIARLRAGQVIREAGYDGEYGKVRLFDDLELNCRSAGGLLFDLPGPVEQDDSRTVDSDNPSDEGPRQDDRMDRQRPAEPAT